MRKIISRWKHWTHRWSRRACGLDETSQLESQVRQMVVAEGWRKQQVIDNMVVFITSSRKPAASAAYVGRRLLSDSPDNSYEVASLFSQLGFDITRRCFLKVAQRSDDDPGIPDDYLFAVTRALGYVYHNNEDICPLIMTAATNSHSSCMRQAAIFVLREIGDDTSIDILQRIARTDEEQIIRRIAREALRDMNAENP